MPPRFLTPATAALTRISFSAVWLTPPASTVALPRRAPAARRPDRVVRSVRRPAAIVDGDLGRAPIVSPVAGCRGEQVGRLHVVHRGALQGGVAVLGPRGGEEDEEGREGDSRKQQGEGTAARPRPTAPDAGHQRLCLMPPGTWDQSFMLRASSGISWLRRFLVYRATSLSVSSNRLSRPSTGRLFVVSAIRRLRRRHRAGSTGARPVLPPES
ncbi:hypothetical protein THAOC_08366 [Thalassiosira oceanica]|uniref:Uncharacterized protein n=1 Tax=Thalassiosira oceanica TaxID=159749 RepID=K0SY30_THAOC|nr:hypothetical protein THAOC_08366 [Thalassiosira oceanica]|eukprot:EJK70285.1 hypothetical protein THAOC_08366 [Thalassiosira oceanica]